MIWLIIILGFILRVVNLDQSLWLDEATQVILSQDPLSKIIFEHGADFHPPLSYLLMHFWMKVSTLEIWLRLFSVIFSVATILFVYKFCLLVFNKKIAIISSLLLSLGPYHLYYSQEVRMYSLTTFLSLVSMYFFASILKTNSKREKILYIISTALLTYTHYFGFFQILAQFMYLLFYKRKEVSKFALIFFVVLILWLPWVPQFFIQLKGGVNINEYLPGWEKVLSLDPFTVLPLTLFKFSIGRIDFYDTRVYTAIAAFVLSLICFLLFKSIKKIRDEKFGFLFFHLLVPLLIAFFISFFIPVNQPFRLLFLIPPFYILIALGLSTLKRFLYILFFLLIFIAIFGIGLYYFDQRFWREDWRGATKFVDQKAGSNATIVFAWPQPFSPYSWYSEKDLGVGIVSKFPATYKEVEEKLQLEGKNEIFFFEYLQQLSDPKKVIQQLLIDKGFKENEIYNFNGVGFVYHYVKSI